MQQTGTVLVVDDEPAIRALVKNIVERAGLTVDTARDGAEAIEKLDAQRYDVVVLDLMMPNVDGYQLIDHLKTHERIRPVIIVVSAGDSAALRHLDGSIVHSVVRKPFDIDVLSDLVTAAVKAAADRPEAEASNVIRFPLENLC